MKYQARVKRPNQASKLELSAELLDNAKDQVEFTDETTPGNPEKRISPRLFLFSEPHYTLMMATFNNGNYKGAAKMIEGAHISATNVIFEEQHLKLIKKQLVDMFLLDDLLLQNVTIAEERDHYLLTAYTIKHSDAMSIIRYIKDEEYWSAQELLEMSAQPATNVAMPRGIENKTEWQSLDVTIRGKKRTIEFLDYED